MPNRDLKIAREAKIVSIDKIAKKINIDKKNLIF